MSVCDKIKAEVECPLLLAASNIYDFSEEDVVVAKAECINDRDLFDDLAESSEDTLPVDVCPLAINGVLRALNDVRERERRNREPENLYD